MIKLSPAKLLGGLLLRVAMLLLLPWGSRAHAFDTVAWQKVLDGFVDEHGLVDYAGLKNKPDALDAFVAALGTHGPSTSPKLFRTRSDSLAFWLNAYNALVLAGVKEAYPVTSVTQILPDFGFFKQKEFRVDGRLVTLDQIEHTIVRPYFKDPRIHAALNCAAQSCPKLQDQSFKAEILEEQLQRAMAEMVRSSQHVAFDQEQKTLYLSQIFNWFQEDFVGANKGNTKQPSLVVVQYINAHLPITERVPVADAQHLKLVYKTYDWSLNDQFLRKE